VSGDSSGHGYTARATSEEILGWFTLFPSKSKTDYSDSATGFYGVLNNTFARLINDERSAAIEQGLQEPWLPSFGGSESGYDDHVKEFYKFWTNFKTIKDFAWCDVYRVSSAPDRRTRRVMEGENYRLRCEAKQEYQDVVREFVQFVRKRDPRYTPQVPKTEAERQEENLARSREQAARARAANAAAQKEYTPVDWAQAAPEVGGLYDDEYSEGEEKERLVFECVACRKVFKTEGQVDAHEKSKKHKQAIFQLMKEMKRENRELGLSTEVSEGEEGEEEEKLRNIVGGQLDDSKDTEGSEEKEIHTELVAGEESEDEAPTAKKAEDGEKEEAEEEAEDSDYVSTSAFHARVFGDDDSLATTLLETSLDEKKSPPPQQPKIGMAKAKREKRKAAAAAASGSGTPVNEFTCAACKEAFTSKTKMFNHLKENPSHVAAPAQVKGNAGAVSGGGGGGKKSKGKRK